MKLRIDLLQGARIPRGADMPDAVRERGAADGGVLPRPQRQLWPDGLRQRRGARRRRHRAARLPPQHG